MRISTEQSMLPQQPLSYSYHGKDDNYQPQQFVSTFKLSFSESCRKEMMTVIDKSKYNHSNLSNLPLNRVTVRIAGIDDN